MDNTAWFEDGTGFIDTEHRIIGRWVWDDWEPEPQWVTRWAWEWTATDLYGLTNDEWGLVFEASTPNPNTRTSEQRIADSLYWKKIAPLAWHRAQKLLDELPRIK